MGAPVTIHVDPSTDWQAQAKRLRAKFFPTQKVPVSRWAPRRPVPAPPPATVSLTEAKTETQELREIGRARLAEMKRQEAERIFAEWSRSLRDNVREGARIIAEVGLAHGVSREDMLSRRRQARLVFARKIAIYRIRRETSLSLPQIGRLMGRRDHTSILFCVRWVEQRLQSGELTL